MENASKALVIAGAVLISILIIGIGIAIYNNSGKGGATEAKSASNEISEKSAEAIEKLNTLTIE